MGFYRHATVILLCAAVIATLPACDSAQSSQEITLTINMVGDGSGQVESRTIGIGINCRINDGQVTGDCERTFIEADGEGVVRLIASPERTTNFSWSGACSGSDGTDCEVAIDQDTESPIVVEANFDAKTDRVVMNPPSIAITTAGPDGAVTILATALDEDGDEVPGVVYLWDVDDPSVLSVAPSVDPRQVVVTALADGSAIVTATVQQVVGTTAVDVKLAE